MRKYIIALIIVIPLVILTYITAFACISRESNAVTFYYEKEKNILYIVNIESGRYFSKARMLSQGDTLCITIYKKPIVIQKSTARLAWKIKLNQAFKDLKSGDKIISLESLKEPPTFNYSVKEVEPQKFPCTLR